MNTRPALSNNCNSSSKDCYDLHNFLAFQLQINDHIGSKVSLTKPNLFSLTLSFWVFVLIDDFLKHALWYFFPLKSASI